MTGCLPLLHCCDGRKSSVKLKRCPFQKVVVFPIPPGALLIVMAAGDDDMLLDPNDPPETVPDDGQMARASENETDMHIDEEGRPRFAPARNAVCTLN